jgi:cyclopropane-fatty-acyl-phospholipid synthase
MIVKTMMPDAQLGERAVRAGWVDRWAKRVVLRALTGLQRGRLELCDGDRCYAFGNRASSAEPIRVTVTDPRFYRTVARGGTVGAGEAYMAGWWRCDDVTPVIRLFANNKAAFEQLNGKVAWLGRAADRVRHAWRRNSRAGSRRNIVAHYDLSNDFYQLFLDETMTYSSGIFEHPGSTLAEASIAKLDRICRKLSLTADDHVVEIGTGWGSFAIHAARTYGCRVTTTTISREQYTLARQRVSEAGLDDRVTVLEQDYRDLTGQYDKLVSIEMIEAVGWRNFPAFFRKCGELLKPDGMACIQAITIADHLYETSKRSVDFIKRYIFPGSCLPSVAVMADVARRSSDLTVTHLEDITPHYATTLRAWYDRFQDRLTDVRALGFSEPFIRMWEYYLCLCEAGFRERINGSVQLVLVKPEFRGQPPLGALATGRRL